MSVSFRYVSTPEGVKTELCNPSELIKALPRTVDEGDEEDYGQFDDEPDYPKDCFGCYAPGTEDCDWCEFADECAG